MVSCNETNYLSERERCHKINPEYIVGFNEVAHWYHWSAKGTFTTCEDRLITATRNKTEIQKQSDIFRHLDEPPGSVFLVPEDIFELVLVEGDQEHD